MKHCGMPGLGGSIGECCYCGDTFLAAILGLDSHAAVAVEVTGCDSTLYVHKKCLKALQAAKEFKDLPEASMLRKAWGQNQASESESKPREIEL